MTTGIWTDDSLGGGGVRDWPRFWAEMPMDHTDGAACMAARSEERRSEKALVRPPPSVLLVLSRWEVRVKAGLSGRKIGNKLEEGLFVGETDAGMEPREREKRSVLRKECCRDVDAFHGNDSVRGVFNKCTRKQKGIFGRGEKQTAVNHLRGDLLQRGGCPGARCRRLWCQTVSGPTPGSARGRGC